MRRGDVYAWLVPGLVAPVAERVGMPVWTGARRLAELQWRSADEIQTRAMGRLRPLLEHAAAHVPYHRARFAAAGVRPRDIVAPADLARLPISVKADLREGFPDATTADDLPASRRQRMLTSGSTGLPLEFYWDRSALPELGATDRFWLGWAGTAVWHTRVLVTSPAYFYRELLPSRRVPALLNRWVIGQRTESLPADEATAARFRALVERVACRGDYHVRGYPGALSSLAARLLEEGRPLARGPRAVVSFAETLTAHAAEILTKGFGGPVVNYYSSWEVPQIAQSCPDHPALLHVNAARVLLRIVRDDGTDAVPGEAGRVVVTDLANHVMPFINYAPGDRAIGGGPCPCGRGLPTLARLEGRESEMLRTPSGREVSSGPLGQLLTFVIGIIPYVWEYQAVQTAPDAVLLRVVPTPRFTAEFGERLRRTVEEFLGGEMTVTVEPVSAIAAEPSGKRAIIKSHLAAVPLATPRA
jgi:phenylacetate-CoA ligase